MSKKKIRVKSYTRKRNGKIERVRSHDRNINYNLGNTPKNDFHKGDYDEVQKRLTADNINFIQYKILEMVKLNEEYKKKTSMDDLLEELAFSDDDERAVKNLVANLRSQGLLYKDKLKTTEDGNRVFFEFYDKYDDSEDIEALSDFPKDIKSHFAEGTRYFDKEDDDDDNDKYDELFHERNELYDKLRWIDNKIAFNEERMRKKPKRLDFYLDENRELTAKQEELGERVGEIEEWMEENYDDDLSEW